MRSAQRIRIQTDWKCRSPHRAYRPANGRRFKEPGAGPAAGSHSHGRAQPGHVPRPPPSAPRPQPPGPARRPGSDRQPGPGRRAAPDDQAGPLRWHILITRILTVMDGEGLARGLAGLQATSSDRKDEDGSSGPWQGPTHCPTAVGKCSMCKHFLKTSLHGNGHAGLIKHRPPGWTGHR